MGCSTNLCLVMMLWTARAKLSVPPPGPAVAMNSIGFAGCQAALAAPDMQVARPTAIAASFGVAVILSSLVFCFRRVVVFALTGLVLDRVCDSDRAFLLQRCNLIGVKTVFAQDR